jgi:peptide/nickel transport system substrate-binding protein
MRSRRSWRQLTAVTLVAASLLAACGGDDDDDSGNDGSTPAVTEETTADTGAAGPDTTAAGPDTTTGDSAAPSTTEQGESLTMGGSLTVGIDGEAACYVPHLCSVSYGPGGIRFGVLENLVRPANNTDGYEMQLAESIEPNDDFTQFTVTLREGVQWSDGTPMTAGDIKTLFDTYVFAENSTLKGNVASIASTEAPDDQTVVFTLSAPQAPFPVNLTNVPIYKPVEGLEQTSIPIGTGPFVMESWEPNVQTVLKKNPLYWGQDADGNQLPYLDEIVVVPITSGDTRVNSLESGDIDIAMSTDPLISSSLRDRSTAYEVGLNAGNGLFFNAATAPTDDVRVRQALAFATNKDDIMAAIGGGDPRDEYYVPESDWYSDEASEATPGYDPEQAQTLLDEYINDPARSDGQPAGTPLKIDISVVQGAVTAESIATIAQQQWSEVGVEVTITPKD